MYWTETIVQPRGGGGHIDTSVTEVPEEVDFDSLLGFYTRHLGEPHDVAYTDVPDLGRIDIGWAFAVPTTYELPGPRDDYEMVVIPLIEDPDDPDHLVSAGVFMAQLAPVVDLDEPDVVVLPE